jgi:hypothetical protein
LASGPALHVNSDVYGNQVSGALVLALSKPYFHITQEPSQFQALMLGPVSLHQVL